MWFTVAVIGSDMVTFKPESLGFINLKKLENYVINYVGQIKIVCAV